MSSDSDDSEYVPDENEKVYDEDSGSGSEEENSACGDSGDEGDKHKRKKRKPANKKGRKRRRKVAKDSEPESEDESVDEKEDESKVEDEKARADALWQSFLSNPTGSSKSTGEQKTTAAGTSETTSTVNITTKTNSTNANTSTDKTKAESKEKEKLDNSKAEEKEATSQVGDIKIEENKTAAKADEAPPAEEPKKFTPRRSGGGLSSVLSNLNKKNKLTVLEKSKLDWTQFKEQNNLKEELQTFNRGKHGYLDKQDFLQRTDSRQFEIEKSLRAKK